MHLSKKCHPLHISPAPFYFRCLGNRQSFAAWERNRFAAGFESISEAKRRSEEKEKLIASGARRPKDHVGNVDNRQWQKEAFMVDLRKILEDDDPVNWQDLARQHGLLDDNGKVLGNGGQMARAYAKKMGFPVDQLRSKRKTEKTIRRSKKRLMFNISSPVEMSSRDLKQEMATRISNGKYNIGEAVAKRLFTRLVLEEGKLKHESFVVEGRKIKLNDIRRRILQKLEKYMRLNNDGYFDNLEVVKQRLADLGELDSSLSDSDMKLKLKSLERTRHLIFWHDASIVINHGYLVFTVNAMYDPAVFYTDREWFENFKEKKSIQGVVETPEVYIVGRCKANDEQLSFTDTRVACLQGISMPVTSSNGIVINDIVRVFHGDGPACQLEAGQQKGGNFYCTGCNIHASATTDITKTYIALYRDLSERIELVMKGAVGKRNTLAKSFKPFGSMKIAELKEELLSRNISDKGLKPELQKELEFELCGCQRVPALLHLHPDKTLEDLHLASYEIALLEPMHDISGHIENLITELPHHMDNDTSISKKFKAVLNTGYSSKQIHRACDRRLLLLKLVNNLPSGKILNMLKSLSEIQRILYLRDKKRCSQEVLRLSNQCHLHFIQLLSFFNSNPPKELTWRKLFGKHIHNLVGHASLSLRLMSGRTINSEGDERIFNAIKSIAGQTSCKRPGHVIGNLLIRLQCEEEFKNDYIHHKEEEKIIKEINKLENANKHHQANTTFPYHYIKSKANEWKTYLKTRIPDFLIVEDGKSWYSRTDTGIEFHDYHQDPNIPSQPVLHHFRSSSVKQEIAYLENCWKYCVENDTSLPIHEHLFSVTPLIEPTPTTVSEKQTNQGIEICNGEENETMEGIEICNGEENETMEDGLLDLQQEESNDIDSFITTAKNFESEQHVSEEMECCNTIEKLNESLIVEQKEMHMGNQQCSSSDLGVVTNFNSPRVEVQKEIVQSTEAKALAYILDLPYSDGVIQKIAKIKLQLRENHSQSLLNTYLELIAPLQSQVLREISNLKKEISSWEQNFFIRNNFAAPTMEDINDSIIESKKRLKLGNMLVVKVWGMDIL